MALGLVTMGPVTPEQATAELLSGPVGLAEVPAEAPAVVGSAVVGSAVAVVGQAVVDRVVAPAVSGAQNDVAGRAVAAGDSGL